MSEGNSVDEMPENNRAPMFARGGITALGKCTATLKTHIPDELDFEFRERAQQLGCSPSELLRDLVCIAMRGATFGELTAEERRRALSDSAGPEKGLLRRIFGPPQG